MFGCAGCPFGAGAVTGGAAGWLPGRAGAVTGGFVDLPARSSTLEPPLAACLVARIASHMDVIIKITAAAVVAFDNTVAEPRGPNVVCDPIPPNAPARSAALPLCSSTTMIRKKQTRIWMMVSRMVIQ